MRKSKPPGSVSLVGAGPGDPGLLTLRGAAALRAADVLLYDALASDPIVDLAPESCEKIYVGKRGGEHAIAQSDIETLMIGRAREGKRVVRLKGGDPFVFGRGGEEAQSLAAAGVGFEIVPGITSAIAAAAYAGIPVTHRDFNTAFTVVTGHEDPTKPDSTLDWARLADPHQTLVFLMAMGNLAEIVARLRAHGLAGERRVAIVRDGTRPTQQTLVATLDTVVEAVVSAGIGAPAIVIVGDVVSLREEIAWYDRQPLFGKRILVTRPHHQQREFAEALMAHGGQPILAPTIAIIAPPDPQAARDAVQRSGDYAWVVFTSQNGVARFFEHLAALQKDARHLGTAKVAAIGPRTAAALARHGVRADLIAPRYIGEELAAALRRRAQPNSSVLLYRAKEARDTLYDLLRETLTVKDCAAYAMEHVVNAEFAQKVAACDILTFTSAGTVRGFVANFPDAKAASAAANGKIIACIGPVAADEARENGLAVDVVADDFTTEGLLDALERYVSSRIS